MNRLNTVEIIAKKRDGKILSRDELAHIVQGSVDHSIPDYQLAAFLMAGRIRGFTVEETIDLTCLMADSGERMDLSHVPGIKVDKHSTGGVGDKTSLIVLPIAAEAGLVGAKMSGRGLGHTGGTLDKLESIPGLSTSMSRETFLSQLKTIGLAIVSQTGELAPADKTLYALRDVTATVDSLPLIAASIMSKKLAMGADVLVLDVKYGSGAMLPQIEQAHALAELMVHIAKDAGIQATAILTSMAQPLGQAVGNALEVEEAVRVLKGGGPDDLRQVSLTLAGEQIFLAGLRNTRAAAYAYAEEILHSGGAYQRFLAMVRAQGGTDDLSQLPKSKYVVKCKATASGYITDFDTAGIGRAGILLGAGRQTKSDLLHYGAGFVLHCSIGDFIAVGDVLAQIYGDDLEQIEEAASELIECIHLGTERKEAPPLIAGRISASDL